MIDEDIEQDIVTEIPKKRALVLYSFMIRSSEYANRAFGLVNDTIEFSEYEQAKSWYVLEGNPDDASCTMTIHYQFENPNNDVGDLLEALRAVQTTPEEFFEEDDLNNIIFQIGSVDVPNILGFNDEWSESIIKHMHEDNNLLKMNMAVMIMRMDALEKVIAEVSGRDMAIVESIKGLKTFHFEKSDYYVRFPHFLREACDELGIGEMYDQFLEETVVIQ